MAWNPMLYPDLVLSNDERVVLQTRPHESRSNAVPLVKMCVLIGLQIGYWLGKPVLSEVPYLSIPLNIGYNYIEDMESWAALAIFLGNVSVIALLVVLAFKPNPTIMYLATNERIVWWNENSRKVTHSIPLESVRKMRLVNVSIRKRFGSIRFSVEASKHPHLNTWSNVPEPAAVLSKLRLLTPALDIKYGRRHTIIGKMFFAVGLGAMSLGIVIVGEGYPEVVVSWILGSVLILASVIIMLKGAASLDKA
jgi:hypothetical protein